MHKKWGCARHAYTSVSKKCLVKNCYKIDEEGIVTRLTHLVWTQTCGCKVHNI